MAPGSYIERGDATAAELLKAANGVKMPDLGLSAAEADALFKFLDEATKTGKVIDPMAPSVNPKRFTDAKEIEKWFKRNCTWTVGRECTPQEKGDFLSYLRTQ